MDDADWQSGTPKSHRNSPQQGLGGQNDQQVAPSPNNNAPTPVNGNMLNGVVGDQSVANGSNANNGNNNANASSNSNANNNTNANSNNSSGNNGSGNNNNNAASLFGGDMLGDTSLFGADGDLDWVNSLTGGADGIDFAQYLENMGEDNEGEVGVAGG